MQEIRKPEPVDWDLVMACESKEDAILLCWQKRRVRMSVEEGAERLEISKGQLSKILNGQSGLRGGQEKALQWLCGNYAIRQWCAWDDGFELVESEQAQRKRRKAELLAELDALDKGAA